MINKGMNIKGEREREKKESVEKEKSVRKGRERRKYVRKRER